MQRRSIKDTLYDFKLGEQFKTEKIVTHLEDKHVRFTVVFLKPLYHLQSRRFLEQFEYEFAGFKTETYSTSTTSLNLILYFKDWVAAMIPIFEMGAMPIHKGLLLKKSDFV